MPLVPGLSDAGLVAPRTADYLEAIRAEYVAATGLDVDWDSDLVLGQLTAIMAQLLGQQGEVLQAIYDAFDVNGATGVQLSNLAQIVGVSRKKATKGEVVLTLTGTSGTVITVGKMAEGGGSDGRARWVCTEDVTIPGTGTGSVDALFRAENAGALVALAGEIDAIVTPVPGWTSVTNAEAAYGGTDAETDDELRKRRALSLQRGQGVGIGAIRSKLLDLAYVESAAVIDNPDNNDRIVQGVGLDGNSFLAIVSPNTLTTEQEAEILRLLYDNTPIGVRATNGTDVVGTVIGADGFEKDVSFDYATNLTVNFVVTFTMAPGYSAGDAGPALKALVTDYIEGLLIGQPLRLLAVYALAATIPGVVGVVVLLNGVAADIDPSARQIVRLGTWAAS